VLDENVQESNSDRLQLWQTLDNVMRNQVKAAVMGRQRQALLMPSHRHILL